MWLQNAVLAATRARVSTCIEVLRSAIGMEMKTNQIKSAPKSQNIICKKG